MRHKLLVTATIATPLLFAGCMRQIASTAWQPDYRSVPVRFVPPPEPDRFTETDTDVDTYLVVDSTYDGFSDSGYTGDMAAASPDTYHVALWGGPFDGRDVTDSVTELTPGSYTFAFFDQPHGTVMQGWVNVRNTGDEILNVLSKWKDSIPTQKQQLAYDYEIDGRMSGSAPDVFKDFTKQLRAFDRLERRLVAAIEAERKARIAQQRRVRTLLRDADILIMPGEEALFHPTTQPAFRESDLEAVRAGDVLTKIVLVADHEDARWKLRRVNQLHNDVMRCQEVFKQEVDRLQRRKGLFLLTDHLYDHDKRFVENEIRLQQTLGILDRLNERTRDLRERRLALAFTTELFSPNTNFVALDQEERELLRERSVLEAEQTRIDVLFDETDENSDRRVALERNRQHVMGAIEAIDRQIERVDEARNALIALAESTDVMHRQNDMQLLTATFVGDDLPMRIRQAIERESLMTVRLQATDKVFAPRGTSVTNARTAPRFDNSAGATQYLAATPRFDDSAGAIQYSATTPHFNDSAATTQRSARLTSGQKWQENRSDDRANRTYDLKKKNHECPLWLRLLVPPCWFASQAKADMTTADAGVTNRTARLTSGQEWQDNRRDDYVDRSYDLKKKNHDCPLWLRLLVPPCWFASQANADMATADTGVANRTVRLTSGQEWQDNWRDDRADRLQEKKKNCDCPLWLRLLVPPCWLAD